MQRMKMQIEHQGFSSQQADQLLQQIAKHDISAGLARIIEAHSDSTFILTTNKEEGNEPQGGVKMNMRDTKYLYCKDKVYRFDSATTQFKQDTTFSKFRTFNTDGSRKIIMSHSCICYASTDGFCRIWVSEDLPVYINPGVSIESIKGAILAFEIKNKGSRIESEIARIE